MGGAFPVSPQTVHLFTRPRTANPSRLQKAAALANRIAYFVETGWAELCPEAKDALRKLAYDLISPPKGFRRVASVTVGRALLAWVALRGETDALNDYLAAVRRLINAVLSAIEREHDSYTTQLSEAVSATANSYSPTLPSEDIRDWISRIEAEAHRDI
jgi:hypothetical protein